MKKIKELGIWMDYSNAILMELYNHMINSKKIAVKPIVPVKNNRDMPHIQLHSKEQNHNQAVFFNEISDIIRNYNDILLFGPTNAKKELLSLLKTDHHFENTKIELRNTDKMTENEIHKFVVEYFT